MNRKIAAHYIIPANGAVIKNGIITIDDKGKILEIAKGENNLSEIAGMEFYNGVLVPGFVNVHCHLELSHLKDKIERKTGLPKFVSNISKLRCADNEEIVKAIQLHDNKMFYNGIVAVGDISNNADTINVKEKLEIRYHTFVELFASDSKVVNNRFQEGLQIKKQFDSSGLSASLTPHAPYSVTPELFKLITNDLLNENSIMSIHNQECESENELYKNKTGELYEIFKSQNIDLKDIPVTGQSSLKSILYFVDRSIQTILVHNTYSKNDDIEAADSHFDNLYWCLCPNANLYIENKLPDIFEFRRKKQKICVGTDSLASNSQLSILEELKVISAKFSNIPTEELIVWATINGAQALKLSKNLGSFEVGKAPGINLIDKFDFSNFKLTRESIVKKIV